MGAGIRPVSEDPTIAAIVGPLPTGSNVIGKVMIRKPDNTVDLGDAANPVRTDPTGTTTQPVSDAGGSLTVDTPQLPAALVGARLDVNAGAWLGSTAPTVGQKAMAASVPVTIASDQSAIVIAEPVSVDDNGGSLTVDTPQLPAALVGARLDVNAGAWLGSTAPTVGQKAMAASVPVVLPSDQTVSTQATKSSTSAVTSVAAAIVSTALLAANAARLGACVFNDSPALMFLKLGAVASSSSYTVELITNSYYEVPFGYTGVIDAIWVAAVGSARVTELT